MLQLAGQINTATRKNDRKFRNNTYFKLWQVTLYKSGSDDWKVEKVEVDRKDMVAGAKIAPALFLFGGEKITKDGVTAQKSN